MSASTAVTTASSSEVSSSNRLFESSTANSLASSDPRQHGHSAASHRFEPGAAEGLVDREVQEQVAAPQHLGDLFPTENPQVLNGRRADLFLQLIELLDRAAEGQALDTVAEQALDARKGTEGLKGLSPWCAGTDHRQYANRSVGASPPTAGMEDRSVQARVDLCHR